MSKSSRSRPVLVSYGYLALSMSLVGTYIALTKPLAVIFPLFLLAWIRFGIGGIAMLRWLRRPSTEPLLSRSTRGLIFLESFLGNFLFTICMIGGVRMTSAVSAGVILSFIPAAVAIMSRVFLKEEVSARVWGAVACGVLGIGLLSVGPSEQAGVSPELAGEGGGIEVWAGYLLLMGAVFCEASYAVIGKKLTAVMSPRRISAVVNLWGFVLTTPLGFYAALHFDFSVVTSGTWVLVLFYGLAASVWTVWLWMTGLQGVPASRAGVFMVMMPISAALVGVLVLGETLGKTEFMAFGLALAGLLMATLPMRRKPAA
ncbi:DMT family transporter [Allopusillimonas ginsengisoli]|uniref:DMT family transporter n=1 Tax=Allopusillimonas ginsengisoli TaxID=453575 RepID=UPI00289A9DF7